LKFKAEIVLLVLTITLYIAGAYCYSYEAPQEGRLPYNLSYPYREYAIPLVVVASVLMLIAAVLYSKRK
jgi:predicted membrane channel-forming protein YqfA (hemolysin III family)